MCLCITFVKHVCLLIVSFRCFYASIDQALGVPPQYPGDPYYQPAEQGKRNPPSEHVSSYVFRKYFLHYNIACGSKCQFGWIRVTYNCIIFLLPLPVSPPTNHRMLLLAGDILAILCQCLAMLSTCLAVLWLLHCWKWLWNVSMWWRNCGY